MGSSRTCVDGLENGLPAHKVELGGRSLTGNRLRWMVDGDERRGIVDVTTTVSGG